ncbi:MAG TPA: FAD-dependent oxidoreductase [Pyrinomonadaceae bacterium]|nr:FAD-dependent oxidoreductase [Pyrinomonadaceae bacterium]
MAGVRYDVVVIGAGVFGAWTALQLRRREARVLLLDAHAPGHSRSSSGGETRVIRAGYGPDEIYTRMSLRSLALWREHFARRGEGHLLTETGVLWLARGRDDALVTSTRATLERVGVGVERLERAELARRFPQFDFAPFAWAAFERGAGVLLARRAVQSVVGEFAGGEGGEYRRAQVASPRGAGRLNSISTSDGVRVDADAFVFACGPWLPKLFPELLGERIHTSRQEVFFFGTPAGDANFAPPLMPAWIDFGAEVYGIPDLEGRGLKVALDRHGAEVDPDAEERAVTPEVLAEVRAYVAERFPSMRGAPLVESRVCQYENTSNGDFLIDRHPGFENVWLAGGGSGHGFKHGPAVGDYAAGLVLGGQATEPRFALATKEKLRRRTVF